MKKPKRAPTIDLNPIISDLLECCLQLQDDYQAGKNLELPLVDLEQAMEELQDAIEKLEECDD